MNNRRPPPASAATVPRQQNSQFQFRSRTSSQTAPQQPQGQRSVMNPRGFTPTPTSNVRLPLPSVSTSGQQQQFSSYNRSLTSTDSGIGSLHRNSSSSSSSTWNQNSAGPGNIRFPNQNRNQVQIQNQNRNEQQHPNASRSHGHGHPQVPPAPTKTEASDFDFDDDIWGDDDDDMDMIMASQAVEATTSAEQAHATTKASTSGSGYSYSSQPPSILNQQGVLRDRGMPLHMIRYELALKESTSNGEEVRMEDFMPGGVLGGVIPSSISSGPPKKAEASLEEINELKKINEELTMENYSCKGEVANLRRLLDKHTKEKLQETMNRLNLERDNHRKEMEVKAKASKDYEKLKTDLRYSQNEVRTLSQKLDDYKKLAETYRQLSSSASSSPNASSLNASISNLNLNSSRTTFPSRSTFHARETSTPAPVQLPTLPIVPIPAPPVKVECKTVDVQTEQTVIPETANELARKAWLSMETCRQDILSSYLELIVVKTTKDITLLLPLYQSISDKAENEIILNLKNVGFPYEFMFPDNLKLAEFKLDEKERDCRNNSQPLEIPKFPSQHKDWDGMEGLDNIIRDFLHYQRDIWGGISYVGNDLVRRINFMRQKNPNSLYRQKNLVHFMKLLLWGRHLWKNFDPDFSEHWRRKQDQDARKYFLEDIRKWTACLLWIGNRCFEVQDVRVELRKLVLKTLVYLTSNSYSCFHNTEANYLRLYNFIFYTLTLNGLLNFDNFYHCLQLSAALGRKKFYLKYMCTSRNDASCLAFQFATKGLQFFTSEKEISRKFKIYRAYVDLLVAMGEWCVVHSQCETSEEPVQTDDPNGSSPVFVVNSKFKVVPPTPGGVNISKLDLEVNSFYIYGAEDMDSSVMQVDLDDESQLVLKARDEVDMLEDNNPGPSKFRRTAKHQHDSNSDSEFQFKKPRPPAPSYRPSIYNINSENGDEAATPGCSAKAIRGSAANVSVFEDMDTTTEAATELRNLGRSNKLAEESSIYEDEWDDTEQEEAAFKAASGSGSGSENDVETSADLPCRKFLDCSLWEEMKNRPKVGYCQCRFHLIETFMLMTEEVIKIWRHLKLKAEFKKSKVSLNEAAAEEREEKFENLLEEVKNMEREEEKRSEVLKSNDAIQEEHFISPDSPFWKRLIRDAKSPPCKLLPEFVAQALETAVDIMSNTYMTTQFNIFTAFGSDGANAFLIASSYLLHYLSDLNFCPDTVRLVHYISSSDSVGMGPTIKHPELEFMEGSNYNWAKNILAETDLQHNSLRQSNPSHLSSFHLKFDLEKIPKFDPQNRAIVSAMPRFFAKSLVDLKNRKLEAKRSLKSRKTPRSEKSTKPRPKADDDDVEIVDLCDPATEEKETGEDPSASSSESDCELEDKNEDSDGLVTTDESEEESDSNSPNDEGEGDPSVLPPKQKPNHKLVEDYDAFCLSSIEDPKENLDILVDSDASDDGEKCPKITFSQLCDIFQKEEEKTMKKKARQNVHVAAGNPSANLVHKRKSAKEVCDDLRRASNFSLNNPDLEEELDDADDADQEQNSRIQNMMITLNRRKYYCEDEAKLLWDDYNVDPLPVDV